MTKILFGFTLAASLLSASPASACCKILGHALGDVVTFGQMGRERKEEGKKQEAERAEAARRAQAQRKADDITAAEQRRVQLEANLKDLEEITRLVGPAQALLPGVLESATKGLVVQTEARGIVTRLGDLWRNEGQYADEVYEVLQNARSQSLGQTADTSRVATESRLAAEAMRDLQAIAKAHRLTVQALIEKATVALDIGRAEAMVQNLRVVVENLKAADAYGRSRMETIRRDLEQTQNLLKQLRA